MHGPQTLIESETGTAIGTVIGVIADLIPAIWATKGVANSAIGVLNVLADKADRTVCHRELSPTRMQAAR